MICSLAVDGLPLDAGVCGDEDDDEKEDAVDRFSSGGGLSSSNLVLVNDVLEERANLDVGVFVGEDDAGELREEGELGREVETNAGDGVLTAGDDVALLIAGDDAPLLTTGDDNKPLLSSSVESLLAKVNLRADMSPQ
jgi:hypothetical protein